MMTSASPSFNLWEQPWIPVIMLDGSKKELSISDVIKDAHQIAEIRDENPVFEIGMYRLLIAIVMDVYSITDTAHITALVSQQKFNLAPLNSYKQKYYENFDLFGTNARFYQFVKVEGKMEEKSVAEIVVDLPRGTNSILFHHTYEDKLILSPKVCAKGLCAVSAYSLAGGRGYQPSAAGSPPIYTLIYGDSLFEILLYNCCPDSLLNNVSTFGPAWSIQQDIGKKEYKINEISTMLGLTWQPRSIYLIPKVADPGKEFICEYTGEKIQIGVSSIYFSAGWDLNKEGVYTDPHCAYIKTKDKVAALQLKEDKAFWRFMGPLYLASNEQERRPMIINQFMNNYFTNKPRQEIKFLSYGLATDGKAKIFKWAKEMFLLPKEILTNRDKAEFLIKSIRYAEEEGKNLRSAILAMDETVKIENKRKSLNTFINEILGQYWRDTEHEFRKNLIKEISSYTGTDFNNLEYSWIKQLLRIARKNLEALEQILTKPKDFRQYETAKAVLMRATYKSFPILKQIESPGEASDSQDQKKKNKTSSKKKTQQTLESNAQGQTPSNAQGQTPSNAQGQTPSNATQHQPSNTTIPILPKVSKKSKKTSNEPAKE